jgi:hypothetical protein
MEGYSLKWPVYWKHDASIGAMNIIPNNDVFIPPLYVQLVAVFLLEIQH